MAEDPKCESELMLAAADAAWRAFAMEMMIPAEVHETMAHLGAVLQEFVPDVSLCRFLSRLHKRWGESELLLPEKTEGQHEN